VWLTKPNKQNKNKTKRQDSDGEISDLDEGQCVVRDIRGLLCVFVIRIRRLCMLAVVYVCASVSDSMQCMCSLCLRAHTYTHTFTLSHTHSHTHTLSLPLAGLFASVQIYVRCMFARARTHTHLLSHARSFSHTRRSVMCVYDNIYIIIYIYIYNNNNNNNIYTFTFARARALSRRFVMRKDSWSFATSVKMTTASVAPASCKDEREREGFRV